MPAKRFPWVSVATLAGYAYFSPWLWRQLTSPDPGLTTQESRPPDLKSDESHGMPRSNSIGTSQDLARRTSVAVNSSTQLPTPFPDLPNYFNPSPKLMMDDPCGVASMGGVVDRIIEGSPWGLTWHIKVLSVTDLYNLPTPDNTKACRARVLTNAGIGNFIFFAFLENGMPYWRGHWDQPKPDNKSTQNKREVSHEKILSVAPPSSH